MPSPQVPLSSHAGVLLPGQELSFPFVFQSPGVGIFSELWCLQTGPVLSRGRPIRITLRGVAFQEDCHAHRREEIEVCVCVCDVNVD